MAGNTNTRRNNDAIVKLLSQGEPMNEANLNPTTKQGLDVEDTQPTTMELLARNMAASQRERSMPVSGERHAQLKSRIANMEDYATSLQYRCDRLEESRDIMRMAFNTLRAVVDKAAPSTPAEGGAIELAIAIMDYLSSE